MTPGGEYTGWYGPGSMGNRNEGRKCPAKRVISCVKVSGTVSGREGFLSPTTYERVPSPLCLLLILLASPRVPLLVKVTGLFDLIDLSIPKRVLPRSMVQPGLAMEQACELGTPLRDLHRLDKEFQLMGRFLVSFRSVR
ncbi:hypothetical protein FRX31_029163, partial [Thalictrum thalictroides]